MMMEPTLGISSPVLSHEPLVIWTNLDSLLAISSLGETRQQDVLQLKQIIHLATSVLL